jgi:UDP-N-acetylmuramate--alanine ligase
MIIVLGNAFNDDHFEVVKAKKLGLKIYKYYELVSELINKFDSLSVCGCHGKTTVTAMLSHVLNNTVGTNYLIGDGTGYANKNNKLFIMEACEYKRVFLNYYPNNIIITNIELDHVDYYNDLDDIMSAYKEFSGHAKKGIIACGDDTNVRNLNVNSNILYYGLNEDNDFIAKNVILNSEGSTFDVYYKDKLLDTFTIHLYGKHMVLNSLSVIAYCYMNDIKMEDVKTHLSTFKGAKRRFSENRVGNVITIDDYAHHPTEISVTIESARQKYPNKEIIAVFFENTYSRTMRLYKDFADSLNRADKAYVTDIFSDRERQEDFPNASPMLIVDLLKNGEHLKIGNMVNLVSTKNYKSIKPLLKHDDSVILFMGCKEVYYLKEKLENYLKGGK